MVTQGQQHHSNNDKCTVCTSLVSLKHWHTVVYQSCNRLAAQTFKIQGVHGPNTPVQCSQSVLIHFYVVVD